MIINNPIHVPLTIDAAIIDDVSPLYPGPTHVTPSSEQQTLYTSGFRMNQNVVVDPIPQNYGLITWNGSFLTVS